MAITVPILPPQPEIDEASHVVQIAPTTTDTFSSHEFVKLAAGLVVPSATADPSVFGLCLSEYPDPSGKLTQSVIPVLRARAGQRFWMNVSGAVLSQANLGGAVRSCDHQRGRHGGSDQYHGKGLRDHRDRGAGGSSSQRRNRGHERPGSGRNSFIRCGLSHSLSGGP